MPHPRPHAASRLVLVALVGSLPLGGCTSTEEPAPAVPSQTPVASPTPLTEVDTTGVAVTRGPFCDRVSPTGIEAAIGGTAGRHDSWDNGDTPPVGDRGAEYGCSWTHAGTSARAWVFTPPITRARAQSLAQSLAGDEPAAPTCRPLAGGPSFGAPGAAVSCRLETGGTLVRYAGLFGDAWLTCEVGTRKPDPELERRTGEWCVTVLAAART